MGICVKQVFDDAALPFENELFDIIINRHESFDVREVERILKPGGVFLTQQVGSDECYDLSTALIPGYKKPFPDHTLANNIDIIGKQGFDILFQKEEFPQTLFFDVGAIVYYAKAVVWEFPDFSVERCYPGLCALQEQIQEKGFISCAEHRFVLAAKKQDALP